MSQTKDTGWLKGFKNKTNVYPAYKRPTSGIGTHMDCKGRKEKRCSMQIDITR